MAGAGHAVRRLPSSCTPHAWLTWRVIALSAWFIWPVCCGEMTRGPSRLWSSPPGALRWTACSSSVVEQAAQMLDQTERLLAGSIWPAVRCLLR